MSVHAIRPLAVLALSLFSRLAAAGEADGGIFVATGDVDGHVALEGGLLTGLDLAQKGIDPDEIDYDSDLEGIDPDEIDYESDLEGIDPDEIDYDSDLEGIDPDEIDYDGSDDREGGRGPDGVVVVSTASTILVEGVPLKGIDPDEIDISWTDAVLGATGASQTRAHVLLARQSGVLVKTEGHAILALDAIAVRAQVLSERPYVAQAVADLRLTVVKLVSLDPALEGVELWIEGGTQLD